MLYIVEQRYSINFSKGPDTKVKFAESGFVYNKFNLNATCLKNTKSVIVLLQLVRKMTFLISCKLFKSGF